MVGQDRKKDLLPGRNVSVKEILLFQHAVFLSLYNNAKAHR